MDYTAADRFIVWAEADGHERPLLLTDLPLARLFDEVVVPYQTEEPFFIDGVPLRRKDLKRIKILRAGSDLRARLSDFNYSLTDHSNAQIRKVYGEQYTVRYEAILRENTTDVTAQIIKAYDNAIKPSIRNYLPKRDELISAATRVFVEAMKSLGGG